MDICLFEKGICFVQDLLDNNGKFLPLDDLQVKYNLQLKFLQYFQLFAAIPSCLKKKAQEIVITKRDLLKEQEFFYFSDNRPLSLTKPRCKDYYNLFQWGKTRESTGDKRWSSLSVTKRKLQRAGRSLKWSITYRNEVHYGLVKTGEF